MKHPALEDFDHGTYAARLLREALGDDAVVNAVRVSDRVFLTIRDPQAAAEAVAIMEAEPWTVTAGESDAVGQVPLTVSA